MRLTWGIRKETPERAGLVIICRACGTQLVVPHKKFIATFDLEEPYPEKAQLEKDSHLEVLEGGKVLKFDLSDVEEHEDDRKEVP